MRLINGIATQSLLDHVYESTEGMVTQLKQTELAQGDHKMVSFITANTREDARKEESVRRNWYNYHHVSSPNTGKNSGGRRIKKTLR